MTWTARVAGVADNPVPNGVKFVNVEFTDGSRTFYREFKVTPESGSAEDIQSMILNEVQRIVAVEDATAALANATTLQSTPQVVTNFQARAVLKQMGLFDAVDTAMKADPDSLAFQAWEYANNFYRNGTFIVSLAPSFGLTEEQVDEMFVQAAQIEA